MRIEYFLASKILSFIYHNVFINQFIQPYCILIAKSVEFYKKKD